MPKRRPPLAERIRPPRQRADGSWEGVRLRTDLARACLICWLEGEDYDLLFRRPYCPYEIGRIIHDHIVPYLRDSLRLPGGEHGVRAPEVADAMEWLAVDHLCAFGKFEDDFTLAQMIGGTLEGGWLQVVGGTGGGERERKRWPKTMDALVETGLIQITRPSHQGFHAALSDEGIVRILAQAGTEIAMTAIDVDGPEFGCEIVDGNLVVFEGAEEPMPVPGVSSRRHDAISPRGVMTPSAPDHSSGRHDALLSKQDVLVTKRSEQDVTDWATADAAAASLDEVEVTGAAILHGSSNGSPPAAEEQPPEITLPPRAARWLRAEGLAAGGDGTVQLSYSSRLWLAEATEDDMKRAHRYADDWRRSAAAHRKESAERQFVSLATRGSLPEHHLRVIAFLLADPKARPRFHDPAAEVTRRLAGLHPLWIEGRINKTARAKDVDNRWAYLLAALANRTDHDQWLRDRRSPAIVAAETGEADHSTGDARP